MSSPALAYKSPEEVESLSRKKLQKLSQTIGVRANQKSVILRRLLNIFFKTAKPKCDGVDENDKENVETSFSKDVEMELVDPIPEESDPKMMLATDHLKDTDEIDSSSSDPLEGEKIGPKKTPKTIGVVRKRKDDVSDDASNKSAKKARGTKKFFEKAHEKNRQKSATIEDYQKEKEKRARRLLSPSWTPQLGKKREKPLTEGKEGKKMVEGPSTPFTPKSSKLRFSTGKVTPKSSVKTPRTAQKVSARKRWQSYVSPASINRSSVNVTPASINRSAVKVKSVPSSVSKGLFSPPPKKMKRRSVRRSKSPARKETPKSGNSSSSSTTKSKPFRSFVKPPSVSLFPKMVETETGKGKELKDKKKKVKKGDFVEAKEMSALKDFKVDKGEADFGEMNDSVESKKGKKQQSKMSESSSARKAPKRRWSTVNASAVSSSAENPNKTTPKKFDLKASLARPMTWKAHKGPVKPFKDTTAKLNSSLEAVVRKKSKANIVKHPIATRRPFKQTPQRANVDRAKKYAEECRERRKSLLEKKRKEQNTTESTGGQD